MKYGFIKKKLNNNCKWFLVYNYNKISIVTYDYTNTNKNICVTTVAIEISDNCAKYILDFNL